MGLARINLYDKTVQYQGDNVRIIGLLPDANKYKVLGRNYHGGEVEMPLSVLDQINY